MEQNSYEDRLGPLRRRAVRFVRAVRWRVKPLLGWQRTLLVELRWRLGDETMAIPIYEALRARFPDSRIHVLCQYPELLEDNPHVDAVNELPRACDRYVNLRSGPREACRIEHYARCAGVALPPNRPRLYYRDWTARPLEALPVGDGALVAVSSGASWPTKRWPTERWRALCTALLADGCRVVELGADQDEAIGVGTSLRGATSVREAACVLHAATLFVCCDSGLMHLALAAGTRVLALFGPTDPDILIRNEPKLLAVKAPRDCQGCWNRADEGGAPGTCPRGRDSCLDAVGTEGVLARARGLLSERCGGEGQS